MKTPLILLPGWGFSSRIWQPLITALHDCNARAVYAIDLPGFGAAFNESAVSLDDALTYLDEQLPSSCFLAGWSLGGMLALQFAARMPDRIAGVITIGSNLHFTQDGSWPGMPADDYTQFCARFDAQPEKTWRRFLALQVQGDREPEALLPRLQQLAQYEDVHPQQAWRALQWLGQIDNRGLLSDLPQPLLQIFATDDAITPAAVAAQLPCAPRQTVRVLRHASHALPVSHAATLAAQIAEWIAA